MIDLYSAKQARELDRIAIEEAGIPGIVLMKRAALAVVALLEQTYPKQSSVGVLCGSGNNAADGYIVAGLLRTRGWSVSVARIGAAPRPATDAAAAYQFMQDAGLVESEFERVITEADVLVDALLGTGINRPVSDVFSEVIARVNVSATPVVAVDVPSGLSADTGSVMGDAIVAAHTVTFIAHKIGLHTNDGPEYRGQLQLADLDVPASVYERLDATANLLDIQSMLAARKPRHRNAHKVDHGRLLIVGGDAGMAGAVTMTAEAAMYTGAGMVTVATHPDNPGVVVTRRPEVMAAGVSSADDIRPFIERADVIVMGPGLGRSKWSQKMFDAVIASNKPLVLDADGLNLLAASGDDLQSVLGGAANDRAAWILTPHPGEASRLLNVTSRDVQIDRPAALAALQQRCGGVSLIKGAGTVIGEADQVRVCPYGNPGMAVAGMGDVLSGVLGALLANGLPPLDATCLGVCLHAFAADQICSAQGETGLLATELLPEIRRILNQKD